MRRFLGKELHGRIIILATDITLDLGKDNLRQASLVPHLLFARGWTTEETIKSDRISPLSRLFEFSSGCCYFVPVSRSMAQISLFVLLQHVS